MVLKYRVSLPGIKGFSRVYEVKGSTSLYHFHKQMRADMDFPQDQLVLFKGMDENGAVVAKYGIFDMGAGTIDAVTLEQTIKKGIVSFVYFYDTTNIKSVIVTFEGEAETRRGVVYPVLVESKGPNPIDFENGYIAFEDLPDDKKKPSADEDDDDFEIDDDDSDDEDAPEEIYDEDGDEEINFLIILGPTAVGKTDYSISEAMKYSSPVISCDSRQIYKEMSVGTAVPSPEQLASVKHYFIHSHSVKNVYTAGKYEIEALALIRKLFSEGHEVLVMAGGSGFYVDAVCNGLDDFPPADMELRESLMNRLREEGVESLRLDLKRLDPQSYEAIDIANGQRVVRALEVCIMTGRPFSSFKTKTSKKREFEIEKIGLTRPRDVLYDRIDRRVLSMIDEGLEEEARRLLPYRSLPALQTVGYKEMFDCFDGLISREKAIELIQRNTRHYAKRQMTWWGRDKDIRWIEL